MSEKTLKFKNIRFNKKKFHKSKESIDLFSVKIDEIVVSDKSKHSNNSISIYLFISQTQYKFTNISIASIQI